MIDADGYRANVGIILINDQQQLFWAKRIGQDAWQFPQGGVQEEETPEAALYRELYEEVGLTADQVTILGSTKDWLKYRLPRRLVRDKDTHVCIGQKQKWFLLSYSGKPEDFHFDRSVEPEFDGWCWVSYWHPVRHVVSFKREVYSRALAELCPIALGATSAVTLDPFSPI